MTWVRDEAISRSGWCFRDDEEPFPKLSLLVGSPVRVRESACSFGNPPPDIRQVVFSASDIDLAPQKSNMEETP